MSESKREGSDRVGGSMFRRRRDLVCALPVDALLSVVSGLTPMLIDEKVLYLNRLPGRYYAIDTTEMLLYSRRHCPHCLTRSQNGTTTYYHTTPVLEAIIVTLSGMLSR